MKSGQKNLPQKSNGMLDRWIVKPFVLWVFVFAVSALIAPEYFIWFKNYISWGLGIIMLGMGMTLTVEDFRRVFRRVQAILVGAAGQFIIMPTLAFLLTKIFSIDPAVSIGVIIVGSCPGGTASNVISYLANADVALSVSLTSLTTILSVLVTPALIWLFAGTYVAVDAAGIFLTILQIIILPIAAGIFLNTYVRTVTEKFVPYFPSISVVTIIAIVASVVALSKETILHSGVIVLLVVALHNLLGYLLGYFTSKLFRLTEKECRTIAIEVGMQNSGLGVALAVKHFSNAATALPSAIFSVWHNISGPTLAQYWRRKKIEP